MSKSTRPVIRGAMLALACAALFMPAGHAQQAARPSPDTYIALRWLYIGPEGNRFSAAASILGVGTGPGPG